MGKTAKLRVRWRHDIATIGNTAVGCISPAGNRYWAYGMKEEWEDTHLGVFADREDAKRSVESWIQEHLEA